jgi:hypothetical protein
VATVVSLVLAGGVGLLIFTGIVQLLHLGDLRALRVIRRTPVTPIGSWRPGTGRVAAAGAILDGPAGPQTGPVSGERCAWFRVTLVRTPARGWNEDIHEDVLLDFRTPGPPVLGDRSGHAVLDARLFEDPEQSEPALTEKTTLVHRRAAPVALPDFVTGDPVRDLRRGETLTLTEVRVPYAREVYALALPVREPLTLIRPQGLTVLTPGTREHVLALRRRSITDLRWISRGAGLTGLVLTAAATVVMLIVW